MGMDPIGNERTTHLFMVLGKVGAKAAYTYDFGDSWEHAIVVETENSMAHPKTAVVFQGITISWKLSVIPTTRNMRNYWIGWAANSIRRNSRLMRSIADSHRSNAGGQKP